MAGRRETFHVEGLRELEQNLKALPKATGKNAVRRALKKISEPFIADSKARAPRATGALADSIQFSTRLSPRQTRLARRDRSTSAVEVYAGARALPHAHLVEYGTVNMPPRPFMRPAWDSNKNRMLADLRSELEAEILKAARRMEAKARKAANKR